MPRLLEVALYEFALSTAMLFTVVTAVRWMAGPGTPFAALFPTPTGQLVAMGLLVGVIVALVLGPSMRRETAGHLNPAVSIGLWLLRVVPARVVAPFVVAQLAGSVAGVGLARLVWGRRPPGSGTPRYGRAPTGAPGRCSPRRPRPWP